MRIPHEIVIDRRKHKVFIDGLPFIYPLAEEGRGRSSMPMASVSCGCP